MIDSEGLFGRVDSLYLMDRATHRLKHSHPELLLTWSIVIDMEFSYSLHFKKVFKARGDICFISAGNQFEIRSIRNCFDIKIEKRMKRFSILFVGSKDHFPTSFAARL